MRHKRGRGRPRNFTQAEIVTWNDKTYVIVEHRMRGTKSEYRLIPLNNSFQRNGQAIWRQSYLLKTKGLKSSTASIVTYRANQWLDNELPEGRGCKCECCIHEAQPRASFSRHTGIMKGLDDD